MTVCEGGVLRARQQNAKSIGPLQRRGRARYESRHGFFLTHFISAIPVAIERPARVTDGAKSARLLGAKSPGVSLRERKS